jgi:hypothetical protein
MLKIWSKNTNWIRTETDPRHGVPRVKTRTRGPMVKTKMLEKQKFVVTITFFISLRFV